MEQPSTTLANVESKPPSPQGVEKPSNGGQAVVTAPSPGSAAPAAPASAGTIAPLFGGKRGGKARTDGLIPGSPEAIEADRIRDRERKAADRAKKRALQIPPPLPSVSDQAIPSAGSPVAGIVPCPADPGSNGATVPWTPDMLKPLFDMVLPACEQADVKSLIALAENHKLAPAIIKDVARDAQWSDPFRAAVNHSGTRLGAKGLTALGVNPEHQDGAVFITALIAHFISRQQLIARIEAAAKRKAEQEEKEKPEQPAKSNG